jgi:hypothetical protein
VLRAKANNESRVEAAQNRGRVMGLTYSERFALKLVAFRERAARRNARARALAAKRAKDTARKYRRAKGIRPRRKNQVAALLRLVRASMKEW